MNKVIIALSMLLMCCQQNVDSNLKVYEIEDFFNNVSISGGYFSTDGEKIIYSSNQSGIFNIYEANIQTGKTNQLTISNKESFFVRAYVPNSNDFIYTADNGGNEINHLFLKKGDDTVIDLTPNKNEKSVFYKWSKDNQFLYYLSNKRDARFFDLYKMKIGKWIPEIVYKNRDNFSLADISNDERYLLLSKSITTSENKFFLFDVIENERIEISSLPGSYSSSGFSNDSKSFYYITDINNEFSYLNEYVIESNESSVVYKTEWDVMYSYLSKNEKYRIIGVNEDGKNSVKVIKVDLNLPIKLPSFNNADITSVSFSESEQKIRLSVGSSKMPNNLFIYDIEDETLKKITNSLNPEIDSNNLVNAKVVRYKSFDGLEIPAIYYKPLNASKNNKVPALIWVHGGPGGQSRIGFNPLIQYLTNNGYAILAVNNRGSSGYGKSFYKMDDRNHGEKDLKDCVWGKKWLQKQEYIDENKIGIIGGSYGGYMTMAAMTFTPNEFKAGVNIFGVTNWIRTLKSIPIFWEASRKALYDELGDPFTIDSVRLKKISPLFHADEVKNPVLVLQGANDPRVLQIESDEIVEELNKNNIPVEYIVFDDEGHGFRKKENQIKGYRKIKNFLDMYLKSPKYIEEKNKRLD